MHTLPDSLDNALNWSWTCSLLLGGVKGEPLNLLVFDLFDDPVLNSSILCAYFQFLQIVQVVEVVPDAVFLVFVLVKELSSFLYGWFISEADQTFIAFLVLYLLFYVS